MDRRIGIDQPAPVAFEDIAALGLRQESREGVPGFREDMRDAIEKPVDLDLAAKEDAAQRKRPNPIGVCLGIGKGKRGTPGAAEHVPGLDAQMHAQRWSRLYWNTKENNYRARGLYDKYTPHSGFLRYVINNKQA